jgi:signal transduction histidine kinase
MRQLVQVFLCLICLHTAQGQDSIIDSLRLVLQHPKDDTTRILAEAKMSERFSFYNADSSFYYGRKATEEGSKSKYLYGVYWGYQGLFFYFLFQSDYAEALKTLNSQLEIAEKMPDRRLESMARVHVNLAHVNRIMGHYEECLSHNHIAASLGQSPGSIQVLLGMLYTSNAACYLAMKHPDSALMVFDSLIYVAGLYIGEKDRDSVLWKLRPYLSSDLQYGWPITFSVLAEIHAGLGNNFEAFHNYKEGIRNYFSFPQYQNKYWLMRLCINLANLFFRTRQYDSSIFYANLAYQTSEKNGFIHYQLNSANILAQNYELKNMPDSTIKYLHQVIKTNGNIFSQDSIRKFQLIGFSEQQRGQELAAAKERFQNQVRFYGLFAALGVFFLIAFILFRNNRQKQRVNILLNKQKVEIEYALSTLKSTQQQLIQSEKMASLGELTAGIAHEIQNPLNFVNNFADVNDELIDEMKLELNAGHFQEALNLANGIQENERKIKTHGQRADAIVKGMLQHSRSSSGQKESTDINVLASEWLRLSYHAMRAKDKSFNAQLESHWDDSIPKINIVPQDVGRVFANLFNNAFYAVDEKKKKSYSQNGDEAYEPSVTIMTKHLNTHSGGESILVSVKDNGNGIPQKIVEKIFQPFFTTKPTGQGTGLGLSMSYDIIKAHGGEIRVESEEGKGTEFIVELPYT